MMPTASAASTSSSTTMLGRTVSSSSRVLAAPSMARASGVRGSIASAHGAASTSSSLLCRCDAQIRAQFPCRTPKRAIGHSATSPLLRSSFAPLLRRPFPPLPRRPLLRPPSAISSPPSDSSTDGGGDGEENKNSIVLFSASDWRYRLWWSFSVAAATFTAFFTPWQLAFGSDAVDFYSDPLHSPEAWVEAALALVWTGEIALSFLVAPDAGDVTAPPPSPSASASALASSSSSSSSSPSYLKNGRQQQQLQRTATMTTRTTSTTTATTATSSAPSLVAANYGRSPTFFLDVASVVPWDLLAVALAGGASAAASAGLLPGLSLLRLAALGRLHRVRAAFAQLEYDTRLDLLWVTIARNTALVALAAHAAACGFYFAARASGFDAEALVGADRDFLLSLDGGQRYLMSLWWALSTLSSGEYGEKERDFFVCFYETHVVSVERAGGESGQREKKEGKKEEEKLTVFVSFLKKKKKKKKKKTRKPHPPSRSRPPRPPRPAPPSSSPSRSLCGPTSSARRRCSSSRATSGRGASGTARRASATLPLGPACPPSWRGRWTTT